MTIMKSPRH